jgi:hypothetical protein
MTTKESAHQIVSGLVQRFDEQKESYKKTDYNEALTRRDFIDPFFKALGWDIDNSQGYAEAYREVIHEDKVKVGSATKAPDYSFRLPGGKRLFFVEAKKPSVVVKTEILPAYQVRRYAWSAKLPVSILTDFEEFAVYDCNKKPRPDDKASSGRIKYITYNDYINEFDFLWDTFSKERVLKGSFDKYIAGDAGKKGTTTVDKEFLLSLDEWQSALLQKKIDNNQMDFQHDQSWDSFTTILASKMTAKNAWNKFIDDHEKAVSKSYWAQLRQIDIEAEQTDILNWLQQIVTDNPIPKTIVAFWIGIVKFAGGDKEISTIYFAGADTYDKDDIDWACDPTYLPENRYAQPSLLQEIDDIARSDEDNYEFLDWILPVAYCAFTFDEIIRTKLDKNLFLKTKDKYFVAVGHDSGDYIDVTPIKR